MDDKEPATEDYPVLITLAEAAEMLRASERWLRNRAEDFGGTSAFGPLKFFKDILQARLEAERQECQAIAQTPENLRVPVQMWSRGKRRYERQEPYVPEHLTFPPATKSGPSPVEPQPPPEPLPQAPKPKRSEWTPTMRAAARERSIKAGQDRQERLHREPLPGQAKEIGE